MNNKFIFHIAIILLISVSNSFGQLYDQTNNPSLLEVRASQIFEPSLEAYNIQVADDFIIPGTDPGWTINSVFVLGQFFRGSGPTPLVNVYIYKDDGGIPGENVYTAIGLALGTDFTEASGNLTITLSYPAILSAGHYWISVVADMDYASGNQWGVTVRTIQTNNKLYRRNPDDGFGDGGAWNVVPAPFDHGMCFSLSGTVVWTPKTEIRVLYGGKNVQDAPYGVGTPIPLNLGSVLYGIYTRTFTIQNIGDLTLNLSALTLPANYTLNGAFPTSIAGGSSANFSVKIDATVAGTYPGEISFITDDSDENPFNFLVTMTSFLIPTVTTTTATSITATTAISGGNVTADGGATATARGICWNTSPNPTIANSKTTNGTGLGIYTSALSGLAVGTKYYYRAYATNVTGTYYGVEMSFTTKTPPTFTAFAGVIDTGNEDTEIEITFAELADKGDEASIDGTVTAFVVKSVTSGILKIGTSATTATDYAIGSNDNISAATKAYWTPAKDENGTFDAFAVIAKDNYGFISTGNVTAQLSVTAVNDAPTFTAFAATLVNGIEETEAEITFAQMLAQGNEADIDGTVDAFVVKEVKSGTLKIGTDAATATVFAAGTNDIIDATNKAFWTPIKDAFGTLNAFAVAAKDNEGLESIENATAQIAVANVNDIPQISQVSKSIAEDNILTFASTNFTKVFTDVDGDAIVKIQIKSLPANGILKLGNTIISVNDEIVIANINNVVFIPATDWNGATKFMWNASDGTVYATTDDVLNITVNPVNDQPTATNSTQTINCNEDDASVSIQDIVVTDVDANEEITASLTLTDITAGRLTATSENGERIMAGSRMWAITSTVADVNAALAAVTFVPATNYEQNTSISLIIEDGKEAGSVAITAIMPLNITPVNDTPTSQNNTLTIDEDTEITLSANGFVFKDVDAGDNLTMIKITTLPTVGKLLFNDAIISENQEIAVSEIANLKFVPVADGFGMPYTSFQFKVKDANDAYSAEAYTYTINVKQIDDPTIATDDTYEAVEDAMFTAGTSKSTLINDIDKDGDNLNVMLVSNVQHGTLTLFKSGTFAYKARPNFNGDDSFTYQINDGTSNSNIATVTLKVLPANDRPQAAADFYQTQEDVQLVVTTGGVLDNDSDIDAGDNLTAVLQIAPSNGDLNLNADGTFTYTPNVDFYGDDKFYYSVNDASGNSVVTPVTIRVQSVNDAPVISELILTDGLSFATSEDGKIGGNLLLNIKDIENGNLIVKLVSSTSIGQLVLNNNGTFSYVPNANISGSDSFTFKVFDGISYSKTATVNIIISSVNDAPIVSDDVFSINEDSQLTDNVILNDNDLENDALTVELTKDVANGTLLLNADGTFTYTPKANFYGDDSFAYKAKDGELYSNIVEVVISVNPVNDAPEIDLAVSKSTVVYNTKNSITGISFSDIDNEAKEVEVILSVENGILEIADNISQMTYCFGNKTNKITMKGSLYIINNALNSTAWHPLTYKGNMDFIGTETVNVFVSDLGKTGAGDVQTAETSFTIEVTPVAPIITSQAQSATLCAGESTVLSIGAIGTSLRAYQWMLNDKAIAGATNNVLQLDNLTAENAGDYTCTVEDYGFVATSEVATVNVSSIELNLEKVEIGCNGSRTGSITALTTGGQGNLLYSLNSIFDKRLNRISNVFEQLSKASYTVVVKDELGCSATASTEIGEPAAALSVKLTAKAPKCNGGTDASVEASVEGGVAPYVFDWSNGQTTQTLSAIAANVYSVIVTDANGCVIDNEIRVNEPAAIEVKITNIQNERNAGQNSGSIQALASNGLVPYEYTFGGDIDETTQSSGMLNELNHGVYNIKATDANGCIAETRAEVTARYYKPEVNFSLTTDGLTVATKNNTRAATSYEWNFGDETIILEEAPSRTYNEYNSYYVSLTATNDYGSKTVRKLVTLTPKTSISQTMESGLSIKTYPNPSNGKFTLSYSSNKTIGDLTVKIRNTTGQLISTETFYVAAKEMSKEYDINGINPGLYFVETISNDRVSTQQIVIE